MKGKLKTHGKLAKIVLIGMEGYANKKADSFCRGALFEPKLPEKLKKKEEEQR